MQSPSRRCEFRNRPDTDMNDFPDLRESFSEQIIRNSYTHCRSEYISVDVIADIEYAPLDMPLHISRQDCKETFTFGSQKYTTIA